MYNSRKFRSGLTLVELVIGVVAGLIVILTVSILLVSGHRGWWRAYNYANGNIQRNALETMVAFGKTGRMANKSSYVLYNVQGTTYIGPVLPLPSSPSYPEEVVFGEAVEFRYWDTDLQDSFMDTEVQGNAYALFYVEEGQLKVDRGPYPPGGVDASGNKRNAAKTQILAQNVQSIRFSHTTKNAVGEGQGCVKLELILYDSAEDAGITIKTATLMRNVWP